MKLLPPLMIALVLCAATACTVTRPPAKPLAVATPVPFSDREQLRYSLLDSGNTVVGKGTLTVHRDGSAMRLEQRYEEANAPGGTQPTTDVISILVDAATLQPRSMDRVVTARSSTNHYTSAYAEDARSAAVTRNDSKPRTLKLPPTAYDNESSLWLWRTLSLKDGYASQYVSVNGVEGSVQTVSLVVTGRQHVDVPAGGFDAWRLQVRNGRATRVAWINVDAPHQVVQWDNGSVVFRLEPAP